MVQYNFATANLSFAFALGKPGAVRQNGLKKSLRKQATKRYTRRLLEKRKRGKQMRHIYKPVPKM